MGFTNTKYFFFDGSIIDKLLYRAILFKRFKSLPSDSDSESMKIKIRLMALIFPSEEVPCEQQQFPVLTANLGQ